MNRTVRKGVKQEISTVFIKHLGNFYCVYSYLFVEYIFFLFLFHLYTDKFVQGALYEVSKVIIENTSLWTNFV